MSTEADSQLERELVFPNIYPDIAFDLEFSGVDFNSPPDEQKRQIVGESLSELRVAAKSLLIGVYPDSVVIPMATFTTTPKKQLRLDKYLATRVKRPDKYDGDLPTKGSVVEIDAAVNSVVEDLAINKHPVFQLVDQLRLKHGLQIGRIATYEVVTEVIMQTHFRQFRSAIDDQLEAWTPPIIEEPFIPWRFREEERSIAKKGTTPKKDKNASKTEHGDLYPRPRTRKTKKQQRPVKKTVSKSALPSNSNGISLATANISKAQNRKLPRQGHRRSTRNQKV